MAKTRSESPPRHRAESAVLSPQQLAYVVARADGAGKRVAGRKAGYKGGENGATSSVEKHPMVQQALQAEIEKYRQTTGITRQDVINGILEAIERAKLLAEPGTEIAGWREIAKIHGYYAPEVKNIVMNERFQRVLSKFEQMDTQELLALADGTVIDGEGKEVEDEGSA